jgi:hypothetical protein
VTNVTRTGDHIEYVAPTLTVVGPVREVTNAMLAGRVTDRDFPAGTGVINLSFS